jgi:cell wall hydrolase
MNNFDLEIMARTAVGEARGEGPEGMQAVMWTTVNRFTAKRWFSGQTIAGTILRFEQYSCWMQNDVNYGLITNMTPALPVLSSALGWAADILQGSLPDPTLGSTHYANLALCNPVWVKGATQTVVIGQHTFFKDVA